MTVSRTMAVALHDVAPPFEREIRWQLNRLGEIGVGRCVLHVVPNWHGRYPLEGSPGFVQLLRERMRCGDEIVLHGFRHHARSRLRGDRISRVRATVFAPDTAEFLTLSPAEAIDTVMLGLNVLRELGLGSVSGFCPPGWLISAENRRALMSTGLRYSLGMFGSQELDTGRWRRFPSLGYMGAGAGQESGVALMNAGMVRLIVPRSNFVTVYLHPQITQNRRPLERTLAIIDTLINRERFRVQTFEEWHGFA